jgi:hypothetical protein
MTVELPRPVIAHPGWPVRETAPHTESQPQRVAIHNAVRVS